MINYLDTSALAKLGVPEAETNLVEDLVRGSQASGTSILTRAELTSAVQRAVSRGDLLPEQASTAREQLASIWRALTRITVSHALVERGERLVWDHRLRGYDALHLASALIWQERVDEPVRFCTFDRRLWEVASAQSLQAWPEDLNRRGI